MAPSNAIYISSPGLCEQDQIVLSTALKLLFREGQAFKPIGKDIHHAHLIVLDGDNAQGKNILTQSLKGQVKVIFTKNPQAGTNIISVKKPVTVEILSKLLSKIFSKMQSQLLQKSNLCGNESVLNVLLTAKENRQFIRMGSPGYTDIFIDGENKILATTTDQDGVRSLIRLPVSQLQISKLNCDDFIKNTQNFNISTLHNILWMAGLEISNGSLLPGHSMNQPVKLKAWPNFTRNDFKPEFLKLAAILARQPICLNDLASMSAIPEPDVISFYNAAYAVDLIERNPVDQTPTVTQAKLQTEKTSLFTKIAQRLTFRKKLNAA